MMDAVYEQLWQADQNAHGIEPVLYGRAPTRADAHVVIQYDPAGNAQHRLYDVPNIPVERRSTYTLFEALEDNFNPFPAMGERDPTPEDLAEMDAFIQAVAETPPLVKAREILTQRAYPKYVRDRGGRSWEDFLLEFWFSSSDPSPDPQTMTAAQALESFGASGLVERLVGFINADASVSGQAPQAPIAHAIAPADFNLPIRDFLTQSSSALNPDLHSVLRALVLDGAALQRSTIGGGDTAFEHLFLGEFGGTTQDEYGHQQWKLGGYHFWYKYQRDQEKFAASGDFTYRGLRYETGVQEIGVQTPEMSSISFGLSLFYTDPGTGRTDKYFSIKKTGSLFNGCSPEGLMALAMVRYYADCSQQVSTEINGAQMHLRCENGRFIRTFYPVLTGRTN